MTRWKAYIITQSNRVETVEFDTPNIVREDAIAQCISMYGAKEVTVCNPVSESSTKKQSSNYNNTTSSGGDSDDWEAVGYLVLIGGVLAIILAVAFWPFFLIAGVIYLIIKYALKK
jgi:hypothetical protein